MAYIPLGRTASPRAQWIGGIGVPALVLILVGGWYLYTTRIGAVPRWLATVVGLSLMVFLIVMTILGGRWSKPNDS
jgi:hypothetical protein